ASKFSVDSGVETPSQWYGISQLNACYRLTASVSGKVYDAATNAGLGASQEVTIADNTTGGTTTVDTASDGTFSSRQPIGDSYTVCAKFPSGYGTQSTPTSGAACPSGYAPLGYTFTLASGGSSTSNFGFLALRTISGEIYKDLNLNGTYDPSGTLTPNDQPGNTGWTVNLYDTTSATPTLIASGSPTTTTTPAGGAPYNFRFSASIVPNDSYTLCLVPSPADASTTWVQTQ